jgi:hypothetical protein
MHSLNTFPTRNKAAKFRGISSIWYLYGPLHFAYLIMYGVAYTDTYGAFCTPEVANPPCFLYLNCIFFVGYAFSLYLYKKANFFLEWDESRAEAVDRKADEDKDGHTPHSLKRLF